MGISRLALVGAVLGLTACAGGGGDSSGAVTRRPDGGPPATAGAPAGAVVSTTAPGPATSAQVMCGRLAVTSQGRVASSELGEISGVVASRRHPGVLWVHNDSGGGATVHAIDLSGADRGRVDLTGASAVDWEDIAAGPGPDAGVSHLFVADIGDNLGSRKGVTVYRFPEPDLAVTATTADAVTLRYPDRPHDAEAFMVHPVTGDWYVLTKEATEPATLFRAPRPAPGPSTVTLEALASIAVAPDNVTAGDIAPDGSALVVRTYLSVRVYPITGGDVAGALGAPPCRGPLLREAQGEAIAFAADGRSLIAISEGPRPAVNVIG